MTPEVTITLTDEEYEYADSPPLSAAARIERYLRNGVGSPTQPKIESTHGGGQSYREDGD